MSPLLLFIVSLGCLILLLKWRTKQAQKALEGKIVPNSIESETSRPDGVLFYFYHPQCGPCRQMSEIIDQLVQAYPGRVEKCNVEDCQELTRSIGIKATPTSIFVVNNRITRAIIGSTSGQSLDALLRNNDS